MSRPTLSEMAGTPQPLQPPAAHTALVEGRIGSADYLAVVEEEGRDQWKPTPRGDTSSESSATLSEALKKAAELTQRLVDDESEPSRVKFHAHEERLKGTARWFKANAAIGNVLTSDEPAGENWQAVDFPGSYLPYRAIADLGDSGKNTPYFNALALSLDIWSTTSGHGAWINIGREATRLDLTDEERTALRLAIAGRTAGEIAAELRAPPGEVESILWHAEMKLRSFLRAHRSSFFPDFVVPR